MPFLNKKRLSLALYLRVVCFFCSFIFVITNVSGQQRVYKKINKLKETADGEKLYSQGKYDEAIKTFREAIDKGETRGEPEYYIGTILEQRHQYEESIPYFEDAIRHELQSEFRGATVWKLILLHRKLLNYSEMLTYIDMLEDMGVKHPNLEKFREEAENSLSPDKIKARALFKEGKKIVSDWERQNPDHDFWSENGGGKSRKEVLNKYLEAVSLDDSLSTLYWDIAAHYEKLSDYPSAINVYEKIVHAKDSAEAYYKLGVIYKRNGDFLLARDNFLNALKSLKNEKIKYYILMNLSQVLYAIGNYTEGVKYINEAISESVTENNAERMMDRILNCLHLSAAKYISALHKNCEFKISRNELLKKDVRIITLYYFMEAEIYRAKARNSGNDLSEAKTSIQNYARALIPPSLRNEIIKNIQINPEPESYNEDSWAALPAWCLVQIQHVLPFMKSSGAYRELYLTLLIYQKTILENKWENQSANYEDNKDNYYSMLGISAYEMSMYHEAQSAFLAVGNRNAELEMDLIRSMLKQEHWEAAQDEVFSYLKQNSAAEANIKQTLKNNSDMKKFPKNFMNIDMIKLLDIEAEEQAENKDKQKTDEIKSDAKSGDVKSDEPKEENPEVPQ